MLKRLARWIQRLVVNRPMLRPPGRGERWAVPLSTGIYSVVSCGKRSADVRPNFQSGKMGTALIGRSRNT